MQLSVAAGPAAEEQLHPGLRKKFHRHRVRLGRLHRDIRVLADRIVRHQITLEGMPALMGDHIHVAAGAVEIGEDERRPVIRQIGHIAACLLGFPAEHIEQLVLAHKVHERSGLRRERAVHLPSGSQNLLRRADRSRIALLKIDAFVDVAQPVQTESSPAGLMNPLREGHKILLHLLPEGGHLVAAVAVSPHPRVAQRQIGIVPHRLALLRAAPDQPVVDLLDLLLIRGIEGGHTVPRRLTDRPVRTAQIRRHQRKIQRLPVPLDLRGSEQLVVAGLKCIFLLHEGNDLRIHRLHRQLHVPDRHRPDPFLHVSAVRRRVQCLLILCHQVLEDRSELIVVILLLCVKCIRHIDIVPDLSQRHLRRRVIHGAVIALMHAERLLTGTCRLQIRGQRGELRPEALLFNSCIWKFPEYHRLFPSPPETERMSCRSIPQKKRCRIRAAQRDIKLY